MNPLITRFRRTGRFALVSTLATLVALPLAATIGLAPTASAAEPAAPASRQTPTSSTETPSTEVEGGDRSAEDPLPSVPLDEAVPDEVAPGEVDSSLARADDPFDALVFSKTAAFAHSAIDEAVTAIQGLGAANNFTVTATVDAAAFTEENLAQYEVVIFNSTTGDVLNAAQQTAFEKYIQGGGGYAGLHAASDTEYDWAWYGNLVGAYFANHPNGTPTATVKVEDPAHPSTAGLPATWQRTDEWYNFRTNPRSKVHVLASMDESTYAPGGGAMGAEHPIAWCQDYDGGRSWYTGMGHTEASYADPLFLEHLLGGIETAAGVTASDCKATREPSFQKVALDENTTNPMELAIADDGRVFYIDRAGAVKIILPNGTVVTAGTVPVYTGQEFGLLGIALDPDFATNNNLFLYFAPQGTESIDRISRFTLSGNTMPLASEKKIIDITVQRNECCHAGGSMEFDQQGNLYLATGDNTNPFASDGYNPIDERAGRAAWDAQRTSANTNDLSGKVLKIKPKADGSGYDIPAGNLFDEAADTTQKTRPEIYAMGFRNPFRIGLDEQNDTLLVADYGPDAGSNSATRGPNGRVEWNVLDEPGNYGWPYCVGNNTPYNDYNFASSTAGAAYNCAAPVNDSPNNTGLTNLPAAKPAVIWQSNNASFTGTPEIGASGAPMTSGTYAFDPALVSDRKWPAYFDSKAIWADWNNNRLFTVQMNAAGTGYTDINRFLPSLQMKRPHALQFGPDGALYMIEWGSGFDGNNADSGIYRIDYLEGERSPTARATTDKTSGPAPLSVAFDASTSFDGDTGDAAGLTYAWDFTNDGTVDATTAKASHVYAAAGNYTARLTVTAANGKTGSTSIDIVAGNTAPTVTLDLPLNGGFFEFGDTINYTVTVTDPEDGATIDCSKVTVQPGLGHDQHSHGYEQYQGCSGSFPLPGDAGHVGANIFGTVTATYTDTGSGAAGPLTSIDGAVLHTKHKEAEFFDQTGRTGPVTTGTPGVATQTTTDTNVGLNVTGVETGDWFAWDVMNLTNISGVSMRAASTTAAAFEVRQGSPTGTAIGTLSVPATGGAQAWQTVSTTFTAPVLTSQPLYFVATTGGANVNWLEFAGRGVTENTPPAVTITGTPLTGAAPLPVSFTSTVSDVDDATGATYLWDFGDDTTSTEADPSKTYATPGRYTVSLTVTDARGAKTTKTLEVVVTVASNICFSGRSDDFVGNALDTTRWNRNVRINQSVTVANGSLNIPLTNSDLYQGTNTTPNVVLQDLPAGAFEVTTRVTLAGADKGYQQGGLVLYGNDDNYLKLVYSGRSTSPEGDKAANVIQMTKETAAVAAESNSANLGGTFPDTVWLRLSSTDGNVVSGSWSTDGATFVPLAGANGTAAPTRTMAGITAPKVGLLALGSTAAGAADNLTAEFDYFTLTPDSTATPCDNGCLQGFNGTSVPDGWTVVKPTGKLTVGGGNLTIPMAGTDLYQTTNNAGDVVVRSLPTGGFQAITKVTAPVNRQYQQAGLILYGDDDNYIKLVFEGRTSSPDASGNVVQLTKELNATASEVNTPALGAGFTATTVWLRLTSTDGTAVTGEYSTDGATWTALPSATTLTGITNPRVGVTAFANNEAAATISAQFDSFELKATDCEPTPTTPTDTAAPTTTLAVPAANAAGWWTTRPSFTLSATDGAGGSGVASSEYRIDDGAWTPYTAAVSVAGEGTKVIQYRSKDVAGNTETAKSQTVKIDTVVPTVTAAQAGEGAGPKTVTLTAADATSGVAKIEYQTGTETAWTTYTAPISISAAGSTVVRHRALDVAGNTSAVGTSTVVITGAGDSTKPTVAATVLGSYAGKLVDQASTGITGSATMVSSAATGGGSTTTLELDLAGLDPTQRYESHLHLGTTCGGFAGHYRDDPAGDGVPPNELWPTNPGWTAASGDPRIKAAADGTSYAEATVPWAPRVEGGILALHRDGAIIGCVDLDLTGPAQVVLEAADDTAVTSFTYQVDGGATTAYAAPFDITAPGTHVVSYVAKDAAGNTTTGTLEVVVPGAEEPSAAPTVAVSVAPAAPDGRNGWHTAPVTVTLTGAGGDGALRIEHRLGDGPWTAYTAPIRVTQDGTTQVQARVTDTAGAVSAVATSTVRIDATAPVVAIAGVTTGQKMKAAAVRTASVTSSDATSGVATTRIVLDGVVVTSPVVLDAMKLRVGSHQLSATVTDRAGNQQVQTVTFTVRATYGGAKQLVKRLDREKLIGKKLATRLEAQLDIARRADRRGQGAKALTALTQVQRLSKGTDATTKAALRSLVRQLKAQL